MEPLKIIIQEELRIPDHQGASPAAGNEDHDGIFNAGVMAYSNRPGRRHIQGPGFGKVDRIPKGFRFEMRKRDVLEGQLAGVKHAEINEIEYTIKDGVWNIVVEVESPVIFDSQRVAEMEFALSERLNREVNLELKITQIEAVCAEE